MLQWLSNFGNWFVDLVSNLVSFVMSTIHGLSTMLKSFPIISSMVTRSIGYLPSIFAVFVSITLIIYIVYLIIGRNAGGSE